MSDRLFYPLIALVIVAIVALAAVWPQGDGARSPGPFGHTPTQQTAAARNAIVREQARAAAEAAAAAESARKADEAAAQATAAAAAGQLRR
jgi:hypothetical protein